MAEGKFDPEVTRKIETTVIAYVESEYRWAREAYRIEPQRRTPEGAFVVNVMHRDDAVPGPRGGGGKSVQLQLNAATFAVEKVLHFQ